MARAVVLCVAALASSASAFVESPLHLRDVRVPSPAGSYPPEPLTIHAQGAEPAHVAWSWSSLLGFGAALGLAFSVFAPSPVRAITAEQFSQLTYNQVKGSGLANRCPTVDSAGTSIPVKTGQKMRSMCFEPKNITVEAQTKKGMEFVTTRLVTRQTYTLAEIEGDLSTSGGNITMTEEDGIDFAPATVEMPNAERVPFLFSVKELVAKGSGTEFKPGFTWGGEFTVPSYRTGGFLDPKGRGMYTGYDQAVALPALQADGSSGQERLFKESNKVFEIGKGAIEMEVNKVNADLGEIGGVFVSKQPSDTDMGAKEPKTVLLKGIFYGRVD